jgi:hypothetical protein
MRTRFHLLILLQFALSVPCLAQTDDNEDSSQDEGRYLLGFSYAAAESIEGVTDIFDAGITWVTRPDLRISIDTSYVLFAPSSLFPDQKPTNGLGDTLFSIQYDWEERLTASPWIPDNVGTSLSILAPTGDASKSLGGDTWGASISTSWPIIIKGGWLINPAVNYIFTFNEGPKADPTNVAEALVGIVKLFPSKFWIAYTPGYWYDLDLKTWNFDSHFTVGKMFSNGMGIGLDYGRVSRHFKPSAKDDTVLLFNYYFQFGYDNNK